MPRRRAADVEVLDAPVEADDTVTRVLDAATELFGRHGVGRTSIDDVARRARVGRNTVFRRVGTKDELVRAVLSRELERLLDDLNDAVGAARDPLERMAAVFAITVRTIRAHPMLGDSVLARLEDLNAYGMREVPDLMARSAEYVEVLLAADRAAGQLGDDVDITVAAEVMVRLVHSVILAPALVRPLETEAELRAFATAIFAPLLRV
ncbi:TetR/AcrR family transcriptional regulator [Sporichthya brevicatena]|uniref:TetR/AcrR family transcriptional regulator n=1 Tax=Sporichthya brevicatena TaxID=171442 RepID=A0ABN1GGD4_9ACTN